MLQKGFMMVGTEKFQSITKQSNRVEGIGNKQEIHLKNVYLDNTMQNPRYKCTSSLIGVNIWYMNDPAIIMNFT
jgi:hypothetical protein